MLIKVPLLEQRTGGKGQREDVKKQVGAIRHTYHRQNTHAYTHACTHARMRTVLDFFFPSRLPDSYKQTDLFLCVGHFFLLPCLFALWETQT